MGLREQKKAEQRQRISDVATLMFLDEGYDRVRMADIARAVGISEKTVFNYFPTKESLVLDQADEQLERAIASVAGRPPGQSPTAAYVAELKRSVSELADEENYSTLADTVPRFGDMFESTPALRAAWGDHRHRLVSAIAAVLAADLGVDPEAPEPLTAARALISLSELLWDAVSRHVPQAASGAELERRVGADLDRAARLVEHGIGALPDPS